MTAAKSDDCWLCLAEWKTPLELHWIHPTVVLFCIMKRGKVAALQVGVILHKSSVLCVLCSFSRHEGLSIVNRHTHRLDSNNPQLLPILTSCIHCTPLVPMATMEKPMVAPTMQWVPEMGSLRKEAISCQTADPVMETQDTETSGRFFHIWLAMVFSKKHGTTQSEFRESSTARISLSFLCSFMWGGDTLLVFVVNFIKLNKIERRRGTGV